MGGFWAEIWRSRARASLVGAALCMAIASALYAFNWHTFYDTKEGLAEARAGEIAQDVELLATLERGRGDAAFRQSLRVFLSRRRPHVTVTLVRDGRPAWSEANDSSVDESRTVLERSFEIDLAPPSDGQLRVEVRRAIRPPLPTALVRAWTFSLRDYLRDPERWWGHRLYNRSMPLYGYLLVIAVVGFGTIRALHRDQLELHRLGEQADDVTAELDALRDRHGAEVEELRGAITSTGRQRETAVRERERLAAEIARVEHEYRELSGHAADAASADASAEQLQRISERRSSMQQELRTRDEQVAQHDDALEDVRAELVAAEELLEEVEEKRDDLVGKLQDRNREIRKLRAILEQAQSLTHTMRRGSGQPSGAQLQRMDEAQRRIEEQLGRWIESDGAASVNFSQHSRAGEVAAQFERIDRAFVDRFFTHVTNPEYDRGARRLIRVRGMEDAGSGKRSGELVVVLDDDAGRTLGLRYALTKDAPGAIPIGFVLALLLRASCRDFRRFAIRIR